MCPWEASASLLAGLRMLQALNRGQTLDCWTFGKWGKCRLSFLLLNEMTYKPVPSRYPEGECQFCSFLQHTSALGWVTALTRSEGHYLALYISWQTNAEAVHKVSKPFFSHLCCLFVVILVCHLLHSTGICANSEASAASV